MIIDKLIISLTNLFNLMTLINLLSITIDPHIYYPLLLSIPYIIPIYL